MIDHRQAIRDARQMVHDQMSDPAVYIEGPGARPRMISVRIIRGKPEKVGQAKGVGIVVQFQAVAPKIIFHRGEVPNPAHDALVILAADEGYRVAKGGVERPYNLTITAEAQLLKDSELVGLPTPQTFRRLP